MSKWWSATLLQNSFKFLYFRCVLKMEGLPPLLDLYQLSMIVLGMVTTDNPHQLDIHIKSR